MHLRQHHWTYAYVSAAEFVIYWLASDMPLRHPSQKTKYTYQIPSQTTNNYPSDQT